MRILFLTAEAAPLIKVGGLGDVAGSLPRALRELSNSPSFSGELDVRLVMPYHPSIDLSPYTVTLVGSLSVPQAEGAVEAQVFALEVKGVPVYLIKSDLFPKGAPVYSINTQLDGKKYAFFSLAALELIHLLDWQPDILHANDWHTATAVYVLNTRRQTDSANRQICSVLTVHNLPFMGAGAEQGLAYFNIPPSQDSRLPEWARYLPLPMGLAAADRVVTVSRTYRREILTPEFGCNLQDFLNQRSDSISGILNGIDTEMWDPATDRLLARSYSLPTIHWRSKNKKDLQAKFGLAEDAAIPLLTIISRMDRQKGIDLALEGLRKVLDRPWQLILLGNGNPTLEAAARTLEEDFPDRVRIAIRFDTALSHSLYGGADLILAPSRYEPCGLAPMIAMHYGCVPLARATGGMRDTILDPSKSAYGSGFLFERDDPADFAQCLRRALFAYTQPDLWRRLQHAGMSTDFSWRQSALAYARLYQDLVKS